MTVPFFGTLKSVPNADCGVFHLTRRRGGFATGEGGGVVIKDYSPLSPDGIAYNITWRLCDSSQSATIQNDKGAIWASSHTQKQYKTKKRSIAPLLLSRLFRHFALQPYCANIQRIVQTVFNTLFFHSLNRVQSCVCRNQRNVYLV